MATEEPLYTGNASGSYYASPAVADVVNLAVALKRPLLVEGEPGCGKTKLAYSIAKEKCLPQPLKISVKSTTRAKDLLYTVNSLRRLQDAQNKDNENARYVYPYLSLGPLGAVIRAGTRCVLLIDEVDKADIDFPNDLLDVLEDFTFQIEDLPPEEEDACKQRFGFGRVVSRAEGASPIVVITSNREKRLPEAFLRRCLYVRLRFPESAEELRHIVLMNVDGQTVDRALVDAASTAFQAIRKTALGATRKPPSTSELIDWVRILYWTGVQPQALADKPFLPPHWETLFKTGEDLDAYAAAAQKNA
jgi:MoxR-like ATPase